MVIDRVSPYEYQSCVLLNIARQWTKKLNQHSIASLLDFNKVVFNSIIFYEKKGQTMMKQKILSDLNEGKRNHS